MWQPQMKQVTTSLLSPVILTGEKKSEKKRGRECCTSAFWDISLRATFAALWAFSFNPSRLKLLFIRVTIHQCSEHCLSQTFSHVKSICKATCSLFPLPASCQKKYPDNTWERLSLGPAADCQLLVLSTRQNRRGLCSWMSSSDKRHSGWKMPCSWKTRQHQRLQADHWYENLTEQSETSNNNYLKAFCFP